MSTFKPARYTECVQYSCLEDLNESSLELSLIHCGKEQCEPLHIVQGTRDETIVHFVFSGKGTYSIGNKIWNVSAGQMFILFPGVVSTYFSDSADPWDYGWIAFKGTHVENILLHCGLSLDTPVGTFNDVDIVREYIDKILEYRTLSYANDLKRHGYLFELLGFLTEQHSKATGISAKHDYSENIYVNHAIEYISKFYNEGINVTSIAEYIGITRAHLNNCFNQEVGMSVQKFLIDYRLHQAAQLLNTTTDSINEIALNVGYPDPLAFSKAFKKKYGKSPKFFRSNQQELLEFDKKL